jgi:hypothetical protein
VTEKDFHGPRPAAQWDSIPAPELARLRRIKDTAWDALVAYDECEGVADEKMDAAMDELRDALRDDLR